MTYTNLFTGTFTSHSV